MLNMQLQKQRYMGKSLQNKRGCKKYSFIRKSTCLISADECVMYACEHMPPEPRCHFGKLLQLGHLEQDLSSLNYSQRCHFKKVNTFKHVTNFSDCFSQNGISTL